jgi:hypothetical protein
LRKWNPDAIERQLAHQDTSAVRRAYARGEYWDERVAMMQHCSDYAANAVPGRPAWLGAPPNGDGWAQ